MIESNPLLLSAIALLATVFFIDKCVSYAAPNLDAIPVAGPAGRLTSFFGTYRFLRFGREMIQEGIRSYKHAPFRVPMVGYWTVVISQPALVNDIRQARDEDLSLDDFINEDIQVQYVFGSDFMKSNYQNDVIRLPLTRNLASRFPEIRDEIAVAFDDIISLQCSEWVPVRVLESIMQVVCRTSNRFLVGLPLCRTPDYRDLNIKFTDGLLLTSTVLHAVPRLLWPILGPLLSPMPGALTRCQKHLEPFIIQRLKDDAELGVDRPDRPNDLISWLIDAAPDQERNVQCYIKRIIFVNVATLLTTSHTFTKTLLQLAARPEYIQPLREEVEAILSEDGWSKGAIEKMRKIDSFIRECMRWEGLACLVMHRQVRSSTGFTFSDGTHLPQGTHVAVAGWDIHHSADNYAKPFEFDGLRFFNMNDKAGQSAAHRIVNTSVNYVEFGHGRHACPGRFFAAIQLKAMLAHVVLTYDVKLDGESLPPSRCYSFSSLVDKEARVMFRKRQA